MEAFGPSVSWRLDLQNVLMNSKLVTNRQVGEELLFDYLDQVERDERTATMRVNEPVEFLDGRTGSDVCGRRSAEICCGRKSNCTPFIHMARAPQFESCSVFPTDSDLASGPAVRFV